MADRIKRILLFGGTSEGREISEYIAGNLDSELTVSVATEYGELVLSLPDSVRILRGRLGADEMSELMAEYLPDICVDATHPYAKEASENIHLACQRTQTEYIRIERKPLQQLSDYISVSSVREAAKMLEGLEGNILITTGAKELSEYMAISDYKERCYVRVLPVAASIEECVRCDFPGKHIIAMQGPFSMEMNEALIREYEIKNVVTKNSGERGGFAEKCGAAEKCNSRLIVIERPEQRNDINVMSKAELIACLNESCIEQDNKNTAIKPEVSIVAMGPGGYDCMTNQAVDSIRKADLIIGANRLLEVAKTINNNSAKYIKCYDKEEILNCHLRLQGLKRVALLYSGDLGLSSGANGMLRELKKRGYSVRAVSGVSSVIYLLNSLGISWESTAIISSHGRNMDINNLIESIRLNRYTALLPYDREQISQLAEVLLGEFVIHLGSSLTMKNERIVSFEKEDGKLQDYIKEMDSMFVAVFERKDIC